jgi:uncharacterized membrane protein
MSRRGLIIALVASAALNLFVIGGVAGAALMGLRMHGGPLRPPPPRQHVAGLGVDLPPPEQRAWRDAVGKAMAESGPKFREARALRRQAWQSLGADPVDLQAVQAQLGRARTLEAEARGRVDAAVVGFAGGLAPEERREMAEALSRARLYGPPRAGPDGSGRRRPGPAEPPPDLPER